MDKILNAYKMNKEKSSLFSQAIVIDHYDGPTEAVCQIRDSEEWFIASLVYFNPDERIRIFTLLKITEQSLVNIKTLAEVYLKEGNAEYAPIKQAIEFYYKGYTGTVFLFMSDWLSSIHYQIIEIPNNALRYFSDIEAVLEQDKRIQGKWMQLFSS
ncbi:MAG: hypothetical protein QM726_14460 [Chitinophagaceae bacterium]